MRGDDEGLGFTLDNVITCGMRRKGEIKLIWYYVL